MPEACARIPNNSPTPDVINIIIGDDEAKAPCQHPCKNEDTEPSHKITVSSGTAIRSDMTLVFPIQVDF